MLHNQRISSLSSMKLTFCIEFFLFSCHGEKKEKVPKILQEALLNFRQMMELSSKQMDQNVFFFIIILFFSRFFNVWSSGVLWRKLVFMSVEVDGAHSVEILGFSYHSDFTWNQFWRFLKFQNCSFSNFRGSENDWNMVNFSFQKMQKFIKIKIQSL